MAEISPDERKTGIGIQSGPDDTNAFFDLHRIEKRSETALLGRVRGLVEKYPDRALSVIRGWMGYGGYY